MSAAPGRDDLIEHVAETQRRMRHHLMAERGNPLLDTHLTMSQLKVLIILYRTGGLSANELAKRTGASPATLTGVVDRMVAQDLVSRREDPNDRRVRRLEATEAGSALVDRLVAGGDQQMRRLLGRLDDAALRLVVRAFDLLLEAAAGLDHDPAGD